MAYFLSGPQCTIIIINTYNGQSTTKHDTNLSLCNKFNPQLALQRCSKDTKPYTTQVCLSPKGGPKYNDNQKLNAKLNRANISQFCTQSRDHQQYLTRQDIHFYASLNIEITTYR